MQANDKCKREKHVEEFKREAVRLPENGGERTVSDSGMGLGAACVDAQVRQRHGAGSAVSFAALVLLACASHDPSSPGSAGSAGSTGSASKASNPPTPTTKITCEWQPRQHPSATPDCQCRSEGGVSDALDFSGVCYDDTGGDTPTLWCADPDYPHQGSCFLWELDPWRCNKLTDGCRCSFTYESSLLFCDENRPGYSDPPAHCCVAGETCTCLPGRNACKAGETPVSDCAYSAAIGIPSPPTSCPSGQVQVTTCGMPAMPASTPSTTETEECPGSCRIDGDLACCPERIDGSCEMYCCDASGCS